MKKFFISLLVILFTLVFWFFTWTPLQELAYKGDGSFNADAHLGPILTNYSITFSPVKLNKPNTYRYKFKRFPSNNTTWITTKIDGLTKLDTEKIPEVTVTIKENGEIIFQRDGKLIFDDRYSNRGEIWVGVNRVGQSSFDANWFSEYEIELRIHSAPRLDKDFELGLRLISGWK